jgi:hypothetical protein
MLQLQFIIVPTAFVVLAAFTWLAFILAARAHKRSSGRFANDWIDSGWAFGAIMGSIFSGVLLIVTVVILIPFNAKYWTYDHVAGTVASVTNRFVSGTGDLSGGDYVLGIAGQPGVYNVQDDRIQGVNVGGRVDLTCTVQWVYAGQDQNNCFIRSW